MARNVYGLTLPTRGFGLALHSKRAKSKRKSIGKQLRDHNWIKYMGNRVQGKCYCCKIIPIHFTNFEVGHNKSVYRGGNNHINNLRPICRTCNRKMGTRSIEWYRNKFFTKPNKKVKVNRKIKRAKPRNTGFGLTDNIKFPEVNFDNLKV